MSMSTFFKSKIVGPLEPAFYAKQPPTIKYAAEPNASYVTIPTTQFAADRKFEWTESIVLSPEFRDTLWQDKKHPKLSATRIEERLHNPLDLVIIKLNDVMGEGLALSKESKAIPAGGVITIYAGAVEDSLTPSTNNYTMPVAEPEQKASAIAELFSRPRINASQHRGFGSYIIDAASMQEIQASTLPATALSNVLEENCVRLPVLYKGCPIQVFIACRDIQPGELITSAYEGSIWANAKRCVLNKNLEMIGHFNKRGQIELNPTYKPTPEMAAPRINMGVTAVGVTLRELSSNKSVDKFDYKLRFTADIQTALNTFAARLPKNSNEEKFVTRLKVAFNSNVDADNLSAAYTAAQEVFRDKAEFDKVKARLAPLKAEFIFHMTKYNEGIRNANGQLTTTQAAASPSIRLGR
jgi:hypothetical protein